MSSKSVYISRTTLRLFLETVAPATVYPSGEAFLHQAIGWRIAQFVEWRCTYEAWFQDSGLVRYYTPSVAGDVRVEVAQEVEALVRAVQTLVGADGVTARQVREVVGDG
jgi:hypothetical protein